MTKKTKITICLGSSCFARGNKKMVQIIDSYIKQNKLEDKVFFHGEHCFGKCEKGPIIKINNKFYENVDLNRVVDIIAQEIKK